VTRNDFSRRVLASPERCALMSAMQFQRQHAARTGPGACLFAAALFLVALPSLLPAAELAEVQARLLVGQYAQVIREATRETMADQPDEEWPLLAAQAMMAVGQFTNAFRLLDRAVEQFPYSIRVRLAAHDVFRANGHTARAAGMLEEINQLAGRRDWAYRDPTNRVALGRAAVLLGADPKKVLDLFFTPARKAAPDYREAYLASGELALRKNDFALAGRTFNQAAERFPEDPEIIFGVAQAFAPSDTKVMEQAIQRVLELNTNHVGARLLIVDNQVDAEEYVEAEEILQDIEKINPAHPELWSYRAVLAHLRADAAGETSARARALKTWSSNPAVDHLIGRKLSQKYRFAEGAAYQRRALAFDPEFVPAKNQLAQDLLRLGADTEGWQLAEEVNRDDPYDVVAYNLTTLKDNLGKYRTLTNAHFILRMQPREADIYGAQALALLDRARTNLTAKYGLELTNRVTVEVFHDQKDFAIRTFGLPGGAGFLGVCFGNVITANSPATRPGTPANWEAILWHEFCHVVTLNLTRNKMPRWLSEGISVYEERQANPAWGEKLTPQYRQFILGDQLTPISDMSAAFLKAKSPLMLQFAYYQSSLVVEFLVERYGLEKLRAILADLGRGVEINAAIAKHTAPMKQLETEFAALARERTAKIGAGLDWEKATKETLPGVEARDAWETGSPTNYNALMRQAQRFIAEKNYTEAIAPLRKVIAEFPPDTGATSARTLLASAYRGLKDEENERAVLLEQAALASDAPDTYARLMELEAARKNWPGVLTNATRFLAVNPLLPEPHRARAEAAEALGEPGAAIESWHTLLALDPPDPAEAHYRLGRLLHQAGDARAKRHVLQALEEAPRYRDAHRLLLELSASPARKETNTPPSRSFNF
jgi:tetratricopeptide (TPR) repeat protein